VGPIDRSSNDRFNGGFKSYIILREIHEEFVVLLSRQEAHLKKKKKKKRQLKRIVLYEKTNFRCLCLTHIYTCVWSFI
jgi:hypothetical protein